MVYGASSSSAINIMLILDMQFLFISYENVKNVNLRSYQKPYFEEQTKKHKKTNKTLHWKLKIEQHEGFQKGKHFLLHLCGFYIIALL